MPTIFSHAAVLLALGMGLGRRLYVKRFWKVALSALVALAIGMIMSVVTYMANDPRIWSHPEWLWSIVQGRVLACVVVPVAVLSLVTFFARPPSTGFCIFVALAWLTLIFVLWAKKPWMYYGEFPWEGFRQHWLNMLPLPLSFGLAFAVCARNVLGADPSFNPDAPKRAG